MKYIIATLGCKVNQYESEAMDQILRSHGHESVEAGQVADAILVNSCAVTAEGARKVRQTVRRLQKEHPGAIAAVCGCWSQVEPEAAASLGADVLFGTGDRQGFVRAVEAMAAEKSGPVRQLDNPFRRESFEELPAGAYEGHTRAYLKIQDGCDNFCSYCIIPFARGRVLSLSKERCAAGAKSLAEAGYREIVVTGIEIASWGKDLKQGETLIDAMEAIAAAAPEVRLHLGSLEPTIISGDFVQRLSRLNVCRHFHLSLQSGCSETLARMRRKYDADGFYRAVERLREAFPGCALTADLICGFPGETEEEFEATLAFLETCAFSAVHVFPYSIRPGTRAAEMPGQLEKAEKARRTRRAQAVAKKTGKAYLASCVGQILPVLFEREQDGVCTGHGDNYAEVSVSGEALRGLVKNVKITGIQGEMLVGVCV